MSKKEKQILIHKKNSRGLSMSAQAVHGSTKGSRFVAPATTSKTRAEVFLQNLKMEIKKAI
ncbi:MAG: hypothetical protein HQL21_02740 [Candidatus Omnitrophica bacterium]|nr:hypothetical protein [Candidatus Omnitrophota bacterium]